MSEVNPDNSAPLSAENNNDSPIKIEMNFPTFTDANKSPRGRKALPAIPFQSANATPIKEKNQPSVAVSQKKSPTNSRTQSPANSRSQSPANSRNQSPVTSRTQSPAHSRTHSQSAANNTVIQNSGTPLSLDPTIQQPQPTINASQQQQQQILTNSANIIISPPSPQVSQIQDPNPINNNIIPLDAPNTEQIQLSTPTPGINATTVIGLDGAPQNTSRHSSVHTSPIQTNLNPNEIFLEIPSGGRRLSTTAELALGVMKTEAEIEEDLIPLSNQQPGLRTFLQIPSENNGNIEDVPPPLENANTTGVTPQIGNSEPELDEIVDSDDAKSSGGGTAGDKSPGKDGNSAETKSQLQKKKIEEFFHLKALRKFFQTLNYFIKKINFMMISNCLHCLILTLSIPSFWLGVWGILDFTFYYHNPPLPSPPYGCLADLINVIHFILGITLVCVSIGNVIVSLLCCLGNCANDNSPFTKTLNCFYLLWIPSSITILIIAGLSLLTCSLLMMDSSCPSDYTAFTISVTTYIVFCYLFFFFIGVIVLIGSVFAIVFLAVFALQVGIATAFANATSALVEEITDCCNVFFNDIRETRHKKKERKRRKIARQKFPDMQIYYHPPPQQDNIPEIENNENLGD